MAHTCKKCGSIFENEKELNLHRGLVHGEDVKETFKKSFFSLGGLAGAEMRSWRKKKN
jgi:hypothetical protein